MEAVCISAREGGEEQIDDSIKDIRKYQKSKETGCRGRPKKFRCGSTRIFHATSIRPTTITTTTTPSCTAIHAAVQISAINHIHTEAIALRSKGDRDFPASTKLANRVEGTASIPQDSRRSRGYHRL